MVGVPFFCCSPASPRSRDGLADLALNEVADQPFSEDHADDQGEYDSKQHAERDELEQGLARHLDAVLSEPIK
jgi:hypothetical protein